MNPSLLSIFAAGVLLCGVTLGQGFQPRMGEPLAGLDSQERARFDQGALDFDQVLTVAGGLGPIFNQNSCSSCHNNPVGGSGSIAVTRFGFFDAKGGGFDPLAFSGGSLLQSQTISLACQETVPAFANVTAQRVTSSILGAGLIEAIPEADLLALQANPPGSQVSGVAAMVPLLEDPAGPLRVGRFGWKGQLATLLSFSADAALEEMGMTNRLLPNENAPNGNQALLAQCDGVADPEDGPDANGRHFIDRVTDFQRFLAAPPQTPRAGMSGELIFNQIGCADCHTPAFVTSDDPSLPAALRDRLIQPYSDFLLHDMGLNADFIVQADADEREMKTPPLWGVRVRDPLWHDGRVSGGSFTARMEQAIALHDALLSEGAASAQAYAALSGPDKARVIAFLDSLGRAEFDSDGDGDVDRDDLLAFLVARDQPGLVVDPDSPEAVFDVDRDQDVDWADFDVLVQAYQVDCNGNGASDLADIFVTGVSGDGNLNYIPDECEHCQPDLGGDNGGGLSLQVCGDVLDAPGRVASVTLAGADPQAEVLLLLSGSSAPSALLGGTLIPDPLDGVLLTLSADASGRFRGFVAGSSGPATVFFLQGGSFTGGGLALSNAVRIEVGL